MRVVNGVNFSDAQYDRIVTGTFTAFNVTNHKEKQAIVKLCADNGISIVVVPLGGNVHRIQKSECVCPTCGGRGYV